MTDATPALAPDPAVAAFIARWSKAEAAERANYVLFLSELCDLLGVPRPDPAGPDTAQNAYVFERSVTFHHRGSTKTSTGRIDLYRRDCFVLEAKQYAAAKPSAPAEFSFDLADDAPKSPKIARGTAAWDRAMLEALSQADRYARSLPDGENPPPFLLVVDVGHVIELYADFTQKGKNYLPFPDARSHRIKLADLARPELRERLRLVWTTPSPSTPPNAPPPSPARSPPTSPNSPNPSKNTTSPASSPSSSPAASSACSPRTSASSPPTPFATSSNPSNPTPAPSCPCSNCSSRT
jgi:hypothetical protein